MRPRLALCYSLLLLSGPQLGWAAAADDTAERARIAAERREVERQFATEQAACRQRFLVTECLDAVRTERRQALVQLQRQLVVLDDAHRRARAAERLQAIQNRQREQDERAAPPLKPLPRHPAAAPAHLASAGATHATGAVEPRRLPDARASAARSPAASAAAVASTASAAAAASAGAAEARRRQADFVARQQAAQAHRQAVTARNQQHDAKRPPAASLPVPPASR